MTPGLQFCFTIKIGKKAIGKTFTCFEEGLAGCQITVSLIFPIHKSSQPSHALPLLSPQEPLLLLFTSKPRSSKSVTILSAHKYFGTTCSYLQGTQGTCRTALLMKAHSLHPQNFFQSSFFSQNTSLFLQQGKHGI